MTIALFVGDVEPSGSDHCEQNVRTRGLEPSTARRSRYKRNAVDVHQNATGAELQRRAVGEVPLQRYPSDDSSENSLRIRNLQEKVLTIQPQYQLDGKFSDEGLEAGGIGGRCLAHCLPALMSEFCIEHSRVWRYVEKTQRILSRRAEKDALRTQMEENAHGECPGQWTGANIRGRSLNAAHVVLAR